MNRNEIFSKSNIVPVRTYLFVVLKNFTLDAYYASVKLTH